MANVFLGIVPTKDAGIRVFTNPEYSTDEDITTYNYIWGWSNSTGNVIWDLGAIYGIQTLLTKCRIVFPNLGGVVTLAYSSDDITYTTIWSYDYSGCVGVQSISFTKNDWLNTNLRYLKLTVVSGAGSGIEIIFYEVLSLTVPTMLVVEDTTNQDTNTSWQVNLLGLKAWR